MKIEIGDTIKALRKSRGMTQNEVADSIGYTQDYIKKIESGKSIPSYEALLKLSRFYNCNLTKYSYVLRDFKSTYSYNLFLELRSHISNKDIENIEICCRMLKNNPDFTTDEPFQLLLYAEALLKSVKEKDYLKAIELCIEGLKVDIPNFQISLIVLVKQNGTTSV